MAYSEKLMEHFRHPRNVGEIPDADGVGTVGNPICLSQDTLIYMNSKFTHITKGIAGQRVLGHDGRLHKIENVLSRPYRGPMYKIVAHNLGSTSVTPEHHVLALKASHFTRKYLNRRKSVLDWYSACELEKGDILLYPVPSETINTDKLSFDVARPKYDYKSKLLPEEIKVDNNFLRLAGYYLSEGYVRTEKSKGTIGFVFGSKEDNYIHDTIDCIKEIFNLKPSYVRRSHNVIIVDFYSARLARFFSGQFGKGALNKNIPHWMMMLPLKKQEALLCGLWRGDGYINDRLAKFVTISEQLAYQVRDLLLRQEIIMSFLEQPAYSIHKRSYAIYVKDDDSLKKLADIVGAKLIIPQKRKNHHKAWYENGYFHVPIWRVEDLTYDGLVYNLEVKDSHSYVSNSTALHNCGDVMSIYIKVEDNKILDIKFKTFGCGAAIATSSMITEMAKGKTLEEAIKITRNDVADALDGLPPIKMHCSNLAADGLRSAIKDYYSKKGTQLEEKKS